jgi:hypothetical protein
MLIVFSNRSPGEPFSEGDTVAFDVPQRTTVSVNTPPQGSSWYMPVTIVAGILLLLPSHNARFFH